MFFDRAYWLARILIEFCISSDQKLGENHPKDLLNEVSRTHQAIQ
jgi:hypothetical protein